MKQGIYNKKKKKRKIVSEEFHHREEVRRIATAVGQKKKGHMGQAGECKRQSYHTGQPQAYGAQKIKFPSKGNLRRHTNISQLSCLAVNYILPIPRIWENCQPQTFSLDTSML